MNRRAFISAAFSGLAAAALGMPTLVEGPAVSRDASWPHIDRSVFPAMFGVPVHLCWGYPPVGLDDEVDVVMLPGERVLTAAEVG